MKRRLDQIGVRTWAIITVCAFLFTIVWGWWQFEQGEDDLREALISEKRGAEIRDRRIDVLEDYVRLCREQPRECREEVPPPEQISPRVIRGPGPSDAQVLSAVRLLLPREVAAYLRENPPADGTDGEDGTDGQDGADGAQGPPGESIKGDQGDPGRDIESVRCIGMTPLTFEITYSDGSTETIECEMLPPVETP